MYQAQTFDNKKDLQGSIKHFWKFEVQRSPHDKIGTRIQFWSHNSIHIYQVSTFVNGEDILGQCLAFSNIWGPKSKVKVTTWPNISKIVVLEPCAHYKRGFWSPICDLGILSQPAGGSIPLFLLFVLEKNEFYHLNFSLLVSAICNEIIKLGNLDTSFTDLQPITGVP